MLTLRKHNMGVPNYTLRIFEVYNQTLCTIWLRRPAKGFHSISSGLTAHHVPSRLVIRLTHQLLRPIQITLLLRLPLLLLPIVSFSGLRLPLASLILSLFLQHMLCISLLLILLVVTVISLRPPSNPSAPVLRPPFALKVLRVRSMQYVANAAETAHEW